jgi:hypothetical protein
MEEERAALRQLAEHTMAHFSKAAADQVKVEASKVAAVEAVIMEVVGDRVTTEGVTSYKYVHYACVLLHSRCFYMSKVEDQVTR